MTTATTVEVAPLANFPVVRDLVIEADGFMEKLTSVKPWIIPKELAAEEGPVRQSPAELEEFKQFSLCINCMLCYSACPVVGNEPEFLGTRRHRPRPPLQHRLPGRRRRTSGRRTFRGEGTVFSCSYANECSEVCPKHVDPAAAVNQAKFRAVVDWATSFVTTRGGEG